VRARAIAPSHEIIRYYYFTGTAASECYRDPTTAFLRLNTSSIVHRYKTLCAPTSRRPRCSRKNPYSHRWRHVYMYDIKRCRYYTGITISSYSFLYANTTRTRTVSSDVVYTTFGRDNASSCTRCKRFTVFRDGASSEFRFRRGHLYTVFFMFPPPPPGVLTRWMCSDSRRTVN
jgi:hypothetical protein